MRPELQGMLAWVQRQHAPLGRFAPFAASALFAGAAFSHSLLVKVLAYAGATVLTILITIDLASELLEVDPEHPPGQQSIPDSRVPLSPFQFVLAGIQAVIYTLFVFFGLGPATPFVFLIPVFLFSCLAAWRNVRLWYRQGSQFASRLYDFQAQEAIRRDHAQPHGGNQTLTRYEGRPLDPRVARR